MPIFEFLFDPGTDLNAVIRRNGDVSTVEQRMHVLPEEYPILYFVRAVLREGPDVCSVQYV